MKLIFKIIFITCVLQQKQSLAATDKVICYYASWNVDNFSPEDINTDICTHINYSFMGVNEDGSLRLDGSDDLLYRLGDLKNRNPNLKLIFSVGGWAEGSVPFSNIAADGNKKSVLADSALWFMQNYNFDGVDIDWEYPGQRGGTPADKENFIDLLWVLRNKFDANGDYLITVAVCGDPDCGDYNEAAISQVVNYINIMSYDFHSASNGKTGQTSPLYASSTDSDWEKTHANCDAAINNWFNRGAAPQKTILGLSFYGHGFTLSDPNNHGVGAPVIGEGDGGSYDKVCALIDGWTEIWDDEQKNPYKFSGNQWIGYDNPESIGLKVQYAKSRNLGGVMMWSVDQDDKDGSCGTQNGLLQAIQDNL